MSALLRSVVIDIGFFPKSAAGQSQPHHSKSGRTGMSSRSVATLLPARFERSRIARLYRFSAVAPAKMSEGFPAILTRGVASLSGAAQILVRAGEPPVERDKLGAARAGEPKVACVVKRELRSFRQDDGRVEIDRLERD